jgi:hypothetical protein
VFENGSRRSGRGPADLGGIDRRTAADHDRPGPRLAVVSNAIRMGDYAIACESAARLQVTANGRREAAAGIHREHGLSLNHPHSPTVVDGCEQAIRYRRGTTGRVHSRPLLGGSRSAAHEAAADPGYA